jgi:leucyl aminopeptidase
MVAADLCSDDGLSVQLREAGATAGEKLWPLPLYEEYKDKIKSEVADMKNSGGRQSGVGSSAMFLKEFTSYPWAHLDIAPMALGSTSGPYTPKGGTGGVQRWSSSCARGLHWRSMTGRVARPGRLGALYAAESSNAIALAQDAVQCEA